MPKFPSVPLDDNSGQNDQKSSTSQQKVSPRSGEDQYFTVLDHEIRRKILLFIGEHKSAGFTQLKKETGMSVGTIYHHLEVMASFVGQDAKKKYYLTELGQNAYRTLNQTQDSLASPKLQEKKVTTPANGTRSDNILFLASLVRRLEKNPTWEWILSVIPVIIVGILSSLLQIESYLFFYFPVGTLTGEGTLWVGLFFLEVLGGFGIMFLMCELLSRLLFSQPNHWQALGKSIGLSYLPSIIYLLSFLFLNLIPGFSASIINKVLMILFQIWSMCILAYVVSHKKFMKLERGFIISVFINYGAFMGILLFRTPIL
jgi:DNA-binding transcriptional ArsR family regulator